MEECALNMEQKLKTNYAMLMGAQVLSSREEYASSMVQRSSYAELKDAQINPKE